MGQMQNSLARLCSSVYRLLFSFSLCVLCSSDDLPPLCLAVLCRAVLCCRMFTNMELVPWWQNPIPVSTESYLSTDRVVTR